jgi:hypothetical protein
VGRYRRCIPRRHQTADTAARAADRARALAAITSAVDVLDYTETTADQHARPPHRPRPPNRHATRRPRPGHRRTRGTDQPDHPQLRRRSTVQKPPRRPSTSPDRQVHAARATPPRPATNPAAHRELSVATSPTMSVVRGGVQQPTSRCSDRRRAVDRSRRLRWSCPVQAEGPLHGAASGSGVF